MAEDNSKSGSRWDVLTQTGAGTPMGELLRRYWWPIAGASEFAEPGTRPVRLLGEDLVLYKDLGGRFGLLDRHCRHRRADLSYGYVEECGLRCNYHGWLYDADGACLAQPYEDMAHPERRLRDEIRIKSYPVEERGGLLWAYLGPEPRPLVPDWEFFSWPNGFRQIVLAEIPCNWFQCQENSIDPVHFEWTHSNWSIRLDGRTGPYTPRHLRVDFSEFEYGFQYKRIREDTDENDRAVADRPRLPVALRPVHRQPCRVPRAGRRREHAVGDVAFQPRAARAGALCPEQHPDLEGADRRPRNRPLDHQPCDEPGFRDLGRAGPHRRPLEGVSRSLRPRHRDDAAPLPRTISRRSRRAGTPRPSSATPKSTARSRCRSPSAGTSSRASRASSSCATRSAAATCRATSSRPDSRPRCARRFSPRWGSPKPNCSRTRPRTTRWHRPSYRGKPR